MITQANITDAQYRTRIGHEQILFQPGVNVLVGSNGSGKSSLIDAVQAEVRNGDQRICRLTRDPGVRVYFYSGEASTLKASDAGGGLGDLTVARQSHGQKMSAYLANLAKLEDVATVVLDEPELALDYFAIDALGATMAHATDVQWIVSTHHPLLFTFPHANVINLDRARPRYAQDVLKGLKKRLDRF